MHEAKQQESTAAPTTPKNTTPNLTVVPKIKFEDSEIYPPAFTLVANLVNKLSSGLNRVARFIEVRNEKE